MAFYHARTNLLGTAQLGFYYDRPKNADIPIANAGTSGKHMDLGFFLLFGGRGEFGGHIYCEFL